MEVLLSIKSFLTNPDFLVSFWSNTFSSLIISSIIGLVIYQYTNIFQSPRLSFVVKQNGFYRDTILLSEDGNGNYIANFQFAIKNSGNKTIKAGEGYWHLYIDTNSKTTFFVSGEKNHSRDLIKEPIYQKSILDINFEYQLLVKKENIEKSKIPYFFATNYGNYPKTVKMELATGTVLFKDMGFIEFELPK